MQKSDTERSQRKSDSKKLAKKLRDLHNKLSEKTVYAVKKHYNVYAIADVGTNESVVKNLPNYHVADLITKGLNREHTTPESVNIRLEPLMKIYNHHQQQILFYNNIVKNTSDLNRRLVMHDRILDSQIHMEDAISKMSSIY